MKNDLIYSVDFNTLGGEEAFRADFCSDGTFMYLGTNIFFIDFNDPCFCREIIIDEEGGQLLRELRANMSLYYYIDEEAEEGTIEEFPEPKIPNWFIEYPYVGFTPINGLEETLEKAFAIVRGGEN